VNESCSGAQSHKVKHRPQLPKLLMAIVRDYKTGAYKKIPRWSVAVIAFALLYVLNPFDIIADFIAIIGFLDDAAVIAVCLLLVEKDLNEYREWKIARLPG